MRFLAHRTSSPIKDVAPPSNMGVQVLIPAALNRPTHTLYSICTAVQPTLQEWSVNRRYSQFLTLRGDLISTLTACRTGCPGCASFALSLKKFAFPRKTWIRTNRIVRKRVKSLQLFLQLIVERVYNDLPKCGVCGDGVKKMVRPFLMRGAQPIGDSTLDKIHHSLSLASYAIVKHKPRKAKNDTVKTKTVETHTQDDEASYTSTDRTDSDPALAEPESPTDIEYVDFASSTLSEDSYGKQYDDAQCTDDAVPLEEAMKQVVLLDKRKSTVEEVALRLSSMWSAYDFDDVLAAAPELEIKLSLTQEDGEEYYGDDTADETSSTIDILGNDMDDIEDEDDVHTDDENNTSLALLQDENNVSMTLLQDSIFDEDDDEDRVARKVDEITL